MEKSRKFFMAAAIEFVCLVILFVIVYFFLAKETNAVTEKETNIGSIVSFDEDGNEMHDYVTYYGQDGTLWEKTETEE